MTEEEKEVYNKFYTRLTLCESFWDIKDFLMNFRDALVLRRIIEKLQKENENIKLYIQTNPNLNEISAVEYTTIRKEAYYQGRAEEQQKAEQIIYENYISKDRIREKMKEVKYLSTAGYEILKELLGEK